MTKKPKSAKTQKTNAASTAVAAPKINKSAAIREQLAGNADAKPKEIVAALAAKGIVVSPNMVSIIKAKAKVKSVRRQAARSADNGASTTSRAGGLDASLVLYQAAQGRTVPPTRIRQAFLTLIELLG